MACPVRKERFNVATGERTGAQRMPIEEAPKMGALMTDLLAHDLTVHPVRAEGGDSNLKH